FNYPVDAAQNMAAAASSFVGALKERIVTDQSSEHERLGLIAPDDITTSATTGRGTRVTMRDTSGKTVADVIIGNPVLDAGGSPGAPTGKRYIREAGKKRVYTTTLSQNYSTRLGDWVQTDLLSLASEQVKRVSIDRYRVDEEKGTITDLKTLALSRTDPVVAGPDQPAPERTWTVTASDAPAPAPVNQAKANDLLAALSSLKIVGVRPKPASLAKVLSGDTGEGNISVIDHASLQGHGFFISANGTLLANEGSMTVACADGVVYTLWIGELATDEATKGQSQGASVNPADKSKGADGRYMMVTVSFDPALVGNAPTKPPELEELEKQAAALPAGQKLPDEANARLVNLGSAYKAQSDGFAARLKAGTERQQQLAKRFASWYYVVDATSLDRLRPTREELTAPAAPAAPTPLPAAIPTGN
ncbi:MAG TPA: DUF4340 domain-containing protein, partial [Phycisphaerales bacterium]|nr:DUF4340 domain-containing protein [Phycisphaerales bacterium]